ncbi:hypothetical protein [Kitasatospora sp. NPDC059327]|uniref:hypothetical protein n=1 Tax=Kitasatospora sp. NPDC059327 TaxID=3346803 RepID=UPI003691ACA6
MSTLVDALRAAHLITQLPLPAGGELSALSATTASTAAPFDVELTIGGFRGTVHGATASGGPASARLTLPLTGLVFGGQADGTPVSLTVTGPAVATVDIDPKGVRWALGGPVGGAATVALTPAPALLHASPGGTAVSLGLTSAALRLADGAPAFELAGTVTVGGLPSAAPVPLDFALTVGRPGFAGGVSATAGPVHYSLGWSGAGGPFPDSIDVSTPFALPSTAVVGVAAPTVGRSVVRARLAHDTGGYRGTVAVESGEDGVLADTDTGLAAAAVLVTATAADTEPVAKGSDLAALTALAAEARTLVGGTGADTGILPPGPGSHGRTTVTAVRFDPATPGRARIDYRAELDCRIRSTILTAGTVAPMRVAVRDALLEYGSGAPLLSFEGASIDVSDTGRWEVSQPSGLLQVTGVRSGHGSSFFELDLRLTFDLGPVHSAGGVLRVSLDDHQVSLQGFSLSLEVPDLVSGEGRIAFGDDGAFSATLRVEITPLNLAADAGLTSERLNGTRSILAVLGVTLPAPIPLADSGLGLFGIEAVLGLNRASTIDGTVGQPSDVEQRLRWQPDAEHTVGQLGTHLFGAGVAVGTLPDLGLAFSALGRVVVRTPDLGLLVALDATVLSTPRDVTRKPDATTSARMTGLLSVGAEELYAGVAGQYHLPPDDPAHPGAWHLLEIDVPAEARYVRASGASDWFVHLGAAPGYGTPIRAVLLPELFAVGAEAFLMLRGNGFPKPIPGLPATPAAGFGAAAGFSFRAKYGMSPVWAELSAGAVAAVGSAPVFVAGSADVRGALHLGPFSLGLNSTLTLRLGPGDAKFAELKACGSIDLWLFELSGCVHLTFGDSKPVKPDPPADPLVSATVADFTGAAATDGTMTKESDGAPAMWPDGVLLLGFAPSPAYTGPPGEPFHGALDQTSSPPGHGTAAAPDGTIGSPGYPGHWKLTGLTLQRLDNGVDVPPHSQLPACWQLPPGVAPNTPTTGRVLALLTHEPALWAQHLLNGGAKDPADPVLRFRRDCASDWSAAPGWAVGGRAVPDGVSWRLPSLADGPSTPGPTPATTATVRATASTVVTAVAPLDPVPAVPSSAPVLPPGTALVPGGPPDTGPVSVSLPSTFPPAEFPGLLPLADLVVVPSEGGADDVPRPVRTTLTLDSPLVPWERAGVAPTLVLRYTAESFQAVEVFTERAGSRVDWALTNTQKTSGGILGVFEYRPGDGSPDPVATVTVRHGLVPVARPVGPLLAVVAVGGVTAVAADAVDHARAAGKASIAERKTSRGLSLGNLFVEDATYRLDVTWAGSLDGSTQTSGGTESRCFRIAGHQAARPSQAALQHDVSTFHPAMLGRYLKGYSAGGDAPVFYDDRLVATFSTDTVSTVARLYGYLVDLEVTRTDPPPSWREDPRRRQLLTGGLAPSAQFGLMDAVDRYGVLDTAQQACTWPVTAADLAVKPLLVGDASYDLAAVAELRSDTTQPDRVRTPLPHVSFRTSHWARASVMFEDLGFGGPVDAVRHLLVRSAPTDPGEDSDGALRAALDRAGADPGPLDTWARTTVLWVPDDAGGHAVGGVLLEAVEPLVRAGRLKDLALTGFVTRTDRAGTTALCVPPGPVPAGPLTLTWQERAPEKADWSSTSATLTLPAPATVPTLALEVWP